MSNSAVPRVLILGGGYVGLYAARQVRKRLGLRNVAITVVDPRPYMTYQPFLPEVASGAIEPRHVLASHRRDLRGCKLVTGKVTEIRHADKTVIVELEDGNTETLEYDHVVVALGAVPRTLPIPGLAEHGIGFKQVEEAVALRDRVFNNLSEAASVKDEAERKRLLTFTFVGGGFAGAEALGEVEDMVRAALKFYPDLHPADVRFVLIEAAPRILPELGDELGQYGLAQLRSRGVEVKLETFLNSCVDGHIVTSDGDEWDSDILVWTAGMKPNPVLANSDLPLNQTGRLQCLPDLRVTGEDGPLEGVWSAGDISTVPDLASGEGKFCPPNAQHAVRQARRLGENIAASIQGEPLKDYFHKNKGIVASLGLHKGVAQVGKIKIKGYPAWMMHRGYHVLAMPTWNRKLRILINWFTSAFSNRDFVSVVQQEKPRQSFEDAANSGAKK
ncbi:NAD(P)/FAD-dependent oxidoreductase [Micrococcales bacterium 31B]|nr:NAD(P)/FAD-dependent oxidoreductase [Micrococcales bacterium 31B]